MKKNRDIDSGNLRYNCWLLVLILSALLLALRIAYYFMSDAERFPITTIKVAANYAHITHKELEGVLSKYVSNSFFMIPINALQDELNAMNWIDNATVDRVWPDTLKIKLVEKNPIAIWNNALTEPVTI